jgi:hypothetical protein
MEILDEVYAIWQATIFLIFDMPPNQLADNFLNKISCKIAYFLWPQDAGGLFGLGNMQKTTFIGLALKTTILIFEAVIIILIFKKIWKSVLRRRRS